MSEGRPSPEPNYVKAWREFRGLTQEQIAEKVGTTGSMISLLENNGRGLSAKWLRRLAEPLGTSPGFLLDHHPDDLPSDVIAIWGEIPDDDRDHAIRVLQTFRRTGTG